MPATEVTHHRVNPRHLLRSGHRALLVVLVTILTAISVTGCDSFKDADQASAAVTQVMRAASDRDVNTFYGMLSTDLKRQLPKAQAAKLLTTGAAQFRGFSSQRMTGYKVRLNTNSPTVLEYAGAITYDDGETGTVTADLVREDGVLRLTYVNVVVPQARIDRFQGASGR